MTATDRYIFVASMDVRPDREALFNEVYDREHVPLLATVDGVIAVQRLVTVPCQVAIGGRTSRLDDRDQPRYSAVYQIRDPDVLTSRSWSEAVERGRWPDQVRPYTFNRRHLLYRTIDPRSPAGGDAPA